MIEPGQKGSNRLVPRAIKTEIKQTLLQGLTVCATSHTLLHQGNQVLVQLLGVSFIGASRFTRVLAENTRSRGLCQGLGKNSEGMGLEQLKQPLFIIIRRNIGSIQDIAKALCLGSCAEATMQRVPGLLILELCEGSNVTFDSLLELIGS